MTGETAAMLTNADGDLCLVVLSQLQAVGQQTADDLQQVVTARDPVSDAILATFEPAADAYEAGRGPITRAAIAIALCLALAAPAYAQQADHHRRDHQQAEQQEEPAWHAQARHSVWKDCLDGQSWCQLQQQQGGDQQ
jgi:hypothetical protein